MEVDFFQLIGGIGLILISLGVIIKKRKHQNLCYIFGGIFLLIYSINVKNFIFIILQLVFIIAATYNLIKNLKNKKR